MTARDESVDWTNVTSSLLLSRVPEEQRPEIANWLAVYRRDVRAAAIREAAAFIDNDDTCECGGCDTCQPRKLANQLREIADAATPTSKEPQR